MGEMEKKRILVDTLLGAALASISNIDGNNFISDDMSKRALKAGEKKKMHPYCGKHTHKYIEMSCVIDGTCLIGIKDAQYVAAKGDLYLYPPETPHYESYYSQNIPYKMLWFSFGMNQRRIFLTTYDRAKGYCIASNLPFIRYNQEVQEKLDVLLNEAGKKKGDKIEIKLALLKLTEQALESIFSLEKETEKDYQRADIKTIEKYIIDNFDKDLSVEKLSRLIMLSPNYLSSIFKKYNKVSLSRFINKIRIEKAKEMIKTGKYNMKETAALAGYEDQYYFCRIFKALTGYTPSGFKGKIRAL